MDIRNRRGLKDAAGRTLAEASYDPKKLILIHTGAVVALSLVLTLIDFALEEQISGTGGLGGVGVRSILETLQAVLLAGQVVAVLFWQIGYLFTALRISRKEPVGPGSLLEGFRQFFPVLRLRVILTLLYFGLTMLCIYGASILFSLTPLAEPIMTAYEIGTEEALLAAMDEVMLPMTAMVLLAMLVVLVPYSYQLRMTEYVLMDEPKAGAMYAIRKSRLMMRGNRINLLKLDLSFWWYYGLEMVVSTIAYGDILLPLFGVELPWSEKVSYYVFLILCYLGQLALYWWRGNEVQVTYAMAYQALLPDKNEEKLR